MELNLTKAVIGYQTDLQDAAVQTVLQQAEALSSTWSVPRPGSGGGNG